MKFRVVYTITKVEEVQVTAESFDDAKSQFEDIGVDGELFFIENEDGEQIVYS